MMPSITVFHGAVSALPSRHLNRSRLVRPCGQSKTTHVPGGNRRSSRSPFAMLLNSRINTSWGSSWADSKSLILSHKSYATSRHRPYRVATMVFSTGCSSFHHFKCSFKTATPEQKASWCGNPCRFSRRLYDAYCVVGSGLLPLLLTGLSRRTTSAEQIFRAATSTPEMSSGSGGFVLAEINLCKRLQAHRSVRCSVCGLLFSRHFQPPLYDIDTSYQPQNLLKLRSRSPALHCLRRRRTCRGSTENASSAVFSGLFL